MFRLKRTSELKIFSLLLFIVPLVNIVIFEGTTSLTSAVIIMISLLIFFILAYFNANKIVRKIEEDEKRINQMKENFMHFVAHDMKDPMTSIVGFLEVLLDETAGPLNSQQKEYLKIMDRSSKLMMGMINDIRDVTKMEALGGISVEKSEISLREAVDDVVRMFSPRLKKSKIHIKVVQKNEIDKIQADYNLIVRSISNLVINALNFTYEKGEIKIDLEEKKDRVYVAVEDTGVGIYKEKCATVFDKFEQIKNAESKRTGTGLGLTITKYIIESHGGRIWVDSEPGKGSRFEFFIPRTGPPGPS